MTQLIRHTIFVKELQSGGNVESDEVIEALIERSLLSCTCIVANVLTQPTSKRPTVEKCLLTCRLASQKLSFGIELSCGIGKIVFDMPIDTPEKCTRT